jgi:acyl-CoA thioester hydrolase
MPLTHTRTFRVRHYECDLYGHVNNAVYLRYMQEAAFDAAEAAGYGVDQTAAMGRLWLARATDIEYLKPLRYGDSAEVKTWIADFRRVRSRRAYEMRTPGSEELVARGYTDWVFLDRATLQPVTIPAALIAAFFPEGAPSPSPPRERFPTAPPPPPGLFTLRRRVTWQDIDSAQHVNNAVYIAYVEDCGIQILHAYGWRVERMWDEGFAILMRRHQIEYLQSAVLDDELEIATWVSGVKRATATRHYTLKRVSDQAPIANVHTLCVWVNRSTGQPVRIPAHFLEDFGPNIATDPQLERSAP